MTCREWGWKFAEGKVAFGGFGDSNLTFTHRIDVARYMTNVLTRIPPSELAWKALRLQGELTVCPSPFIRLNCLLTRSPLDLQQNRR